MFKIEWQEKEKNEKGRNRRMRERKKGKGKRMGGKNSLYTVQIGSMGRGLSVVFRVQGGYGLCVGTRWSWITSVTYRLSWSWRQESPVSTEWRSLGHGAGLGVTTKPPFPPVLIPLVFGRADLRIWSQNGRRVGVLSFGMWRRLVTDVSSLSPELQIAHRTQSSLSLPWKS
jgi:hypothetical protein